VRWLVVSGSSVMGCDGMGVETWMDERYEVSCGMQNLDRFRLLVVFLVSYSNLERYALWWLLDGSGVM
jgi:hypothetical protein